MIWYMLIVLLLILILWLLLVPVMLYTNTERNRYFLSLPGIFRAELVPYKGLFLVRGWILFIPFRFNPFRKRRKKNQQKTPAIKKKKSWRSGNIKTLGGVLRSFRIKRLEADIDTDDFTLNAWLVPVFSAVNRENIHMRVNFEGHWSLLLDLRVTLGALLWNLLMAKYK